MAYDFGDNRIPGEPEGSKPYWRDVGTIDSYFQSNMDLAHLTRIHVGLEKLFSLWFPRVWGTKRLRASTNPRR